MSSGITVVPTLIPATPAGAWAGGRIVVAIGLVAVGGTSFLAAGGSGLAPAAAQAAAPARATACDLGGGGRR